MITVAAASTAYVAVLTDLPDGRLITRQERGMHRRLAVGTPACGWSGRPAAAVDLQCFARRMTDVFPAGEGVTAMFVSAMLRGKDDDPVTTDALLVAVAWSRRAPAALDAVELTPTVAGAAYRRLRGTWTSADAGGVGPPGPDHIVMAEGGTPARFTPAAAEAMRRAAAAAAADGRTACDIGDILTALVADHGSRAAEMLAFCGVDVPALERALRMGTPPAVPERVEPELRRLRDVLIGRSRYPTPPGWRNWLLGLVVRGRVNYAGNPVAWVRLEAGEQARHRGRQRPGTDDVLLAVLATHEVARQYPHLSGTAAEKYHGARLLADAGLRYRDVYAAAQAADLGSDPQPLRAYLPTAPTDTHGLLRLVLAGPDNRATRLLIAAGVDRFRLGGLIS